MSRLRGRYTRDTCELSCAIEQDRRRRGMFLAMKASVLRRVGPGIESRLQFLAARTRTRTGASSLELEDRSIRLEDGKGQSALAAIYVLCGSIFSVSLYV